MLNIDSKLELFDRVVAEHNAIITDLGVTYRGDQKYKMEYLFSEVKIWMEPEKDSNLFNKYSTLNPSQIYSVPSYEVLLENPLTAQDILNRVNSVAVQIYLQQDIPLEILTAFARQDKTKLLKWMNEVYVPLAKDYAEYHWGNGYKGKLMSVVDIKYNENNWLTYLVVIKSSFGNFAGKMIEAELPCTLLFPPWRRGHHGFPPEEKQKIIAQNREILIQWEPSAQRVE